MGAPPLLQSLAFDPILGDVKLIAEAWDAGGLYQVTPQFQLLLSLAPSVLFQPLARLCLPL